MCALPFCKWRKLRIQEVKTLKLTLVIQGSSSYFTKLNSSFKSSCYTRRDSVACPGCMACKEKSQDSVGLIFFKVCVLSASYVRVDPYFTRKSEKNLVCRPWATRRGKQGTTKLKVLYKLRVLPPDIQFCKIIAILAKSPVFSVRKHFHLCNKQQGFKLLQAIHVNAAGYDWLLFILIRNKNILVHREQTCRQSGGRRGWDK